jgi:subtilisin family serine protease/subtilisin-like proprotein convertase family protein
MRSRRAPASRRIRTHLQVEQLEARELLAATIYPPGLIPNDPSYPLQWSLNNTGQDGPASSKPGDDIHAPSAWTITTGSMKTVVGIIDTGIDYNNPDLYLNIWVNQAEIPDFWYTKSSASSTTYDRIVSRTQVRDVDGDGLITFRDLNASVNAGLIWDNNGDGVIDAGDLLRPLSQGGWNSGSTKDGDTAHPDDFFGWNFVKNNNNPFDDNDHGTHIAGIIGANGNDGKGIAGINWNVQLMALKTIDGNGMGNDVQSIAGLNYAVLHGATITNNSYGGSGFNQDMYNAINNARAAGVICVSAAGNGINYVGQNLDVNPFYPAAYNLPNIVSVTATTESDTLPDYANYGKTTVDLGAPGRQILSDVRGNKLALFSGTSMAAAEATGVLALVRSQHPDWQYYQVINQVLATTDPVTALAGKTVTGGRLDAYRAVSQSLTNTAGAYVVSAVPNATGAQPVSSIRLTFNEGINASSFQLSSIVSFTGPNGAIKASQIVPVANSDNRQFDVLFPTQSTAGTYNLQLGVNIKDLYGNLLNQNRNNVNGETSDGFTTSFVIQPTYTFSSATRMAIPDLGVAVSTITITQDVPISDINVMVNLLHTCDNDLYIHLRGPDGTDVVLADRRGGYGHNYTNSVFDDQATVPIGMASAPFTGTFRPDGTLSTFNGKDAKGTWQLIIEDRQYLDSGTLLNWSMTIQQASPPTATAASVRTMSIEEEPFDPSLPAILPMSTSSGEGSTQPTVGGTAPGSNTGQPLSVEAAITLANAPVRQLIREAEKLNVKGLQQQQINQDVVDQLFTQLRTTASWSEIQKEGAAPSLDELLTFFSDETKS